MAIALTELDQDLWFPHPEQALDEPEGLLAMGGDLSQNRLRLAYRHGIFPWYEDDQPLLCCDLRTSVPSSGPNTTFTRLASIYLLKKIY